MMKKIYHIKVMMVRLFLMGMWFMIHVMNNLSPYPLIFSPINLKEEKRMWSLIKIYCLLIFHQLRFWIALFLKRLSLNPLIPRLFQYWRVSFIKGKLLYTCTLIPSIHYTLIYLMDWVECNLFMNILKKILSGLTL